MVIYIGYIDMYKLLCKTASSYISNGCGGENLARDTNTHPHKLSWLHMI